MTDREKDQAEEQPQYERPKDDFVREDIPAFVAEEIDPDSVRPMPGVDEDGNPLDAEDLDQIRRGE